MDIEKYVTILLQDEEFARNVKAYVYDIISDKKIDSGDIFPFLLLTVEVMDKKNLFFEIDEDNVYELFRTLLVDKILLGDENVHKKFLEFFENDAEMIEKINMLLSKFMKLLFFTVKSMSCTWCC